MERVLLAFVLDQHNSSSEDIVQVRGSYQMSLVRQESEREEVTTLSEELVRLEEAREKATDGPWKRTPCGLEGEGDLILSDMHHWSDNTISLPDVDADFIVFARNCPVNFRKLGEALSEATAALYGAREVCGDIGNIGHAIKLLNALEQPHD